MNQQPDLFFPGYMNNPNRSPGSARPGYNTTSGLPSVNRMNQRQMDPVSQSPAGLFPNDDRFNSYDSNAFRHNRIGPSPGFDNNFLGSAQWAYNGGANTVNGAMGGDGRMRGPGARRAGIPSVRFFFPFAIVPSCLVACQTDFLLFPPF